MNRQSISLLAFVGLLIPCLLTQPSVASAGDEGAQIGRYQLAAGMDGLHVIDTTTGQCWSKSRDGEWVDEGSPLKAKAKPQREPVRLELKDESVQLTVRQRESKPIPGSRDRILLHLGDITEGQALLSVKTDRGETLLDDTSVKQDAVVEFSVDKKKFYIQVRELRNILVGTDFGVFEISSRPPRQERRIER